MSDRTRKDARWLAIYGAVFAHQFNNCLTHGHNPTDDDVSRFIDEAEAQADLELDVQSAVAKRAKR